MVEDKTSLQSTGFFKSPLSEKLKVLHIASSNLNDISILCHKVSNFRTGSFGNYKIQIFLPLEPESQALSLSQTLKVIRGSARGLKAPPRGRIWAPHFFHYFSQFQKVVLPILQHRTSHNREIIPSYFHSFYLITVPRGRKVAMCQLERSIHFDGPFHCFFHPTAKKKNYFR